MTHFSMTILGKNLHCNPLIKNLQCDYTILLLEENNQTNLKYRNHIKTKDGYLLILIKNKKNIQITTDYFINLNIEKEKNTHKIPLPSNMRAIDLHY